MVFENKKDHIWWFLFDDIENKLIVSKKENLIDPFMTVSMSKILEETFRDSLVIELYWEKEIEYKINNKDSYKDFEKISFLKILRKYLSKKLRSFIKK